MGGWIIAIGNILSSDCTHWTAYFYRHTDIQHVYGLINDLMYKLGGISTVNVQMNNTLTTTT